MVGDGDHAHERRDLEQRAASLGLGKSVRFTGFVPIEDAWSFAASAAVCISPFFPTKVLASTSPTKLVEYLAMGRPVVCNDHPEQSAIMRESEAGICVAWNVDEFADAIARLLEHPSEAEAMGAKGPAWVAANRTYPIIAEMVSRRYQSLLG
jgi:glycosyltransferase involved in cell wall biosynthesis